MSAWLLGFFALSAAAELLEGRWAQECRGGYLREERFASDRVLFTERNHWDRSCARPAVELLSFGAFTAGEALPLPEGARAIDFRYESVSVRPLSPEAAAAFEQRALCGLRGWEAGAAIEVTGRLCDFWGLGSAVRVPQAGDRRFGIFRRDGERLRFGRLTPKNDGSSPERRPLEWDPEPYQRQPD